jgi:prolyl-tRNA synthetase
VCVMVHGDDQGLVLPPRVAPTQVVATPIYMKDEAENEQMDRAARRVLDAAALLGVRSKLDDRRDKNPGWKYNYWEQRGVPIRVEIGPQDLAAGTCVLVRRDTGAKESGLALDKAPQRLRELLDTIQREMLDAARRERDSRLRIAWDFEQFMAALDAGCLVLTPWCLTTESEEWVKEETKRRGEEVSKMAKGDAAAGATEVNEKGESKALTGAAKTLCVPFVQPPMPPGTPCFTGNGQGAVEWCMWGRSF